MNSIFFQNPVFFYFLPLLALPVIVHLLFRHKKKIKYFPPIEILILSKKIIGKRLIIQQLLLLLVRILLILLILLLFLRPFLTDKKFPATLKNGKKSVILLFDRSMSMNTKFRGHTIFKQQKEEAYSLIDSLGDKDDAAIITFSQEGEVLTKDFSNDKLSLSRTIKNLSTLSEGTKVINGLKKVEEFLLYNKVQYSELVIFSDFTTSSWSQPEVKDFLSKLSLKIKIYYINPDKKEFYQNLVVEEFNFQKIDKDLLLNFKIAKTGKSSEVDLKLVINGKELLTCSHPLDKEELKIILPLSSLITEGKENEYLAGYIEVQDDDLKEDDRYYFSFKLQYYYNVLVIDGSPSSNKYISESYYIERALNPEKNTESTVFPFISSNAADLLKDTDRYFSIFLLNLPSLKKEELEAVKNYLKKGGTIFLAAGENINIDYYNEQLFELMPGHIMGKREFKKGEHLKLNLENITVKEINELISKLELNNVEFWKIFSVNPSLDSGGTVLLKYSNEAPYLLFKNYENGKVFFITSSMDFDWNNFPVKSAFLPFWLELIEGLEKNSLKNIGQETILVSEVLKNEIFSKGEILKIDYSSGKASEFLYKLKNKSIREPGIYKIKGSEAYFAVNFDFHESLLQKIPFEELNNALNSEKANQVLNSAFDLNPSEKKQELTELILFIIALLLLLELYLSGRKLS